MEKGIAVVIAGGGTGGHLYPGLAVAREIARRVPAARVSFAGTASGIEARLVPREGFELDLIRSSGLKGKSLISRARGAALLLPGLADAWRIVSRRRPDVVVGVGGYSSGPVVLAAALGGVPTMVLEQNVVPGLTNRLLSRWVRAAAVAYDEALPYFRGRGFVAGNPVRAEFFAPASPSAVPAGAAGLPRTVLVLGGSQGAHAINVAMAAAAPSLAAIEPSIRIVHQTGPHDVELVREAYRSAALDSVVEAYFDPLAPIMIAADLVVSRAGATTLAELAASGRPAVLLPLRGATDDHQRRNAVVVCAAGAAALVDERAAAGPALGERISTLLADAAALRAMGEAMRRFAAPHAAARIVDRVLALAGKVA